MRTVILASVLVAAAVTPSLGQGNWPGQDRLQAEQCTPESGDAHAWLRRADSATGLTRLGDQILHFHAADISTAMEQSDRVYAPFIMVSQDQDWWFNAATGVERFGPAGMTPGALRLRDYVRTEHAMFTTRDTMPRPANPAFIGVFGPTRDLNPLAVLVDWRQAPQISVVARCIFRDYPRVVLERADNHERLYLDVKTAVPMKLERQEPHYLWGQARAEYVYSTWMDAGPALLPVASVRFIDGVEELRRALAQGLIFGNVVPPDSAPSLRIPADVPPPSTVAKLPAYFDEVPVDTIRVSDDVFLLRTPGYTHAVALARDTVFLFDATTGEWRSRADSSWMMKLFPGHHPVVLVVTDLAWPHIAGVRFWAARGATIITHTISRPFLETVLARRWTQTPDAFEAVRAKVRPVIRTTGGPLALAGGAIRLTPIDGASSEGALIAMIPGSGFLWASDYIQTVTIPSLYASEVFAAVRRAGFTPARVAAEHLPLTPWTAVEAIVPH